MGLFNIRRMIQLARPSTLLDTYLSHNPTTMSMMEEERPSKKPRSSDDNNDSLATTNRLLTHLPSSQSYEVSYAHRDVISGLCLSNAHSMILSGSADGVVKFWKRIGSGAPSSPVDPVGIEFVKSYQAHSSTVMCLKLNNSQNVGVSIGSDSVIKFYDVPNFDVASYINARRNLDELGGDITFSPHCCFIGKSQIYVAVGTTSGVILIFDTIELQLVNSVKLHGKSIVAMEYNFHFGTVISGDSSGVMEIWQGEENVIGHAPDRKRCGILWNSKMNTDLYSIIKNKSNLSSLKVSRDGKLFAIFSSNYKVYLFKYSTCKILATFDETVESYDPLNFKENTDAPFDSFEFGKRCAVEAEILDSNLLRGGDITDESVLNMCSQTLHLDFSLDSRFLLVPSLSGIVIFDTNSYKKVKTIAMNDASHMRILGIHVGDSTFKVDQQALLAKNPGASNLAIDHSEKHKLDPLIVAACWNKKRIYLFSNEETSLVERDMLNEPPEEEIVGNINDGPTKLASQAILRTTMGDIHLKLFPEFTPKTVENFITHAKNGYYDDLIFHRIIKGFMCQTGCPLGDGTGGESIWGGEFEDEIHRNLRHDRPFTLSMANAGPNTNGSQFFITTVPTPWLDSKHTVFGRVTAGMDVVAAMENVKVDDNDRPLEEISITSIDVNDD